ncbi:hypothetical protein SAMN05192559_12119 [Halobacillus karajensis]|uniref:hypothetical protein n=1 Tax=Halobacillus karajensis TaxID=195088 RepID=UPI0008A805DE|nr:hypothetical protein SAMN05192559_12119 [Halobacillus karajensis]
MLVKKPTHTKINVIDSIMGSGKTSWAIQYMNNSPRHKRFIYITPFLNEVKRVIDSTDREFTQPQNENDGTKLDDFNS